MGSQWVDGSPTWGDIGTNMMSGLMGAPAKAAQQTHLIETIKDQRIKRAREEEAYQAAIKSSDAFAGTLPQQTPAVSVVGPMVGDMSNPVDTAGIPTVEYRDPRLQAQLESNNKLATAAARQLALKGEADKLFPLSATGTVAATGVPDSGSERARLQFLTTGKFPTAEERALPAAHNMVIKGPNDEIIDQFSTRNGVTTEDGRRLVDIRSKMTPDQRLLAAGAASTTAPNAFENEGASRQRLDVILREVEKNGGMTPEQARLVPQLVDSIYKPKRVREGQGDTARIKIVREVPLSPQHQQLLELATTPTTPPAPGAAPIVPPNPNADQVVSKEPISAAELRKEYDALPEVKRVVNTTALYNDVAKSATLPTNRVRDLDLVYSFIKTMDDLTGVRDAEVKMVGATGSWDEIKNELMGRARGEGMDNRTRLNILETLKNRIDQYQEAKNVRDEQFRAIATEGGLAHKVIVPDMPGLVVIDPDKVLNAPRGMNVAPPGGGILSGIFGTTDRRAVPPAPARASDALLNPGGGR